MKGFIWPLLFFIVLSCGSKKEDNVFEQADKSFYPVKSYVQTELAALDSLPVAVFKFTTVNGKTDTTIIEKDLLRKLAEELTSPDITIPPLKEKYKETVFMDETVNSVTLSYSSNTDDDVIRKVDVFVHPETEKVKYIYLEKIESRGDSSIVRKMIWTTGKYMQVTSVVQVKDLPAYGLQEKYVWGTLE